jgi:hypothetical protein
LSILAHGLCLSTLYHPVSISLCSRIRLILCERQPSNAGRYFETLPPKIQLDGHFGKQKAAQKKGRWFHGSDPLGMQHVFFFAERALFRSPLLRNATSSYSSHHVPPAAWSAGASLPSSGPWCSCGVSWLPCDFSLSVRLPSWAVNMLICNPPTNVNSWDRGHYPLSILPRCLRTHVAPASLVLNHSPLIELFNSTWSLSPFL